MGLMWRHIQVLGVKTGIQDNNAHNHKLAINGLRQYWTIWYTTGTWVSTEEAN